MSREKLLYTRAARVRIHMLPVEVRVVRVHVETHVENLALLMEATPERLPTLVERDEEGFATTVQGIRVLLTLDTSARSLLVHRLGFFRASMRGLRLTGAPMGAGEYSQG